MAHDHERAETFLFEADRHTEVLVCKRVATGEVPILNVLHDEEGGWQFLCGGDHGDDVNGVENGDPIEVVCLEHLVARDPSLNELAEMCEAHTAERESLSSPWKIRDETESEILDVVDEHGWWVSIVPRGESGEPAFAYTVGLHATFKHPELLVFGLPHETMSAVLNACGERIRNGATFEPRVHAKGILEGYEVDFRRVSSRESLRAHVGYAVWFYGGDWFSLLQCIWPDKERRWPGSADAPAWLTEAQPLPP